MNEPAGSEHSAVGRLEPDRNTPTPQHPNAIPGLDDLTTRCIRCGFCLEACPTFVLTGQEPESPRGRIYLVRSADEGKLDWESVRSHLDRCLGCRACEPACPSGVRYGQILEIARDKLERDRPHQTKHALLGTITRPGSLKLQLLLGKLWPRRRLPAFLSRLLSGQAPEADLPRKPPPIALPRQNKEKLPTVKGEVYLLEGCAMRVLFPQVHEATRRLLRRVGYVVKKSAEAECCGALHAHNGDLADAHRKLENIRNAMPGNDPIIVNSAGCGSWMRDAGLAHRAVDASVFLHQNGLAEILGAQATLSKRVTYHDACHLAHGQGVRAEPRQLIQAVPGIQFVELSEADRCCGSAGIYNLLQPQMARKLVERKADFIEQTQAEIVALGNPGCHAWIVQSLRERGSQIKVLHTLELLESAFANG